MNSSNPNKRNIDWMVIVKGWFFGGMAFLLPIFIIAGIFSRIVQADIILQDVLLGVLILPVILAGQGLLISLIVMLGLKVTDILNI